MQVLLPPVPTILFHRLRYRYFTIRNGQKPMSAPHPGSEGQKLMHYCVSLKFVSIFLRKKANEAIALNPHCLILAFRNTPGLKYSSAKGSRGAIAP